MPKAFTSLPQFTDFCNDPPAYPIVSDMPLVEGVSAAPNGAVILTAGSVTGRWVVSRYFQVTAGIAQQNGCWSPDSGHTWSNSVADPTRARKADNSGDTEAILWDLSTDPNHPGAVDFTNFPLLAAHPNPDAYSTDPRNMPTTVYMVFMGRAEADTNPNNSDIFIARSTDGGQNFSGPSNDLGRRVIRLTDADLDDTSGAFQFFPSIAVDEWGTIHIQYYVGRWDAGLSRWVYRVKLAHIQDFDAVNPGGQTGGVSTINLTNYEFDLDDQSIHAAGVAPRIGDYMNSIDTRGCQIISGYIAPQSAHGPLAVFASFALIPNSACTPDAACYANCDGSTIPPALNVNDFACFLEKFASSDTYANCDHSTTAPTLNVNDFSCFLNKFSVGCS